MKLPNNLPMPTDLSKAEIIDLLLREEYGYLPPAPKSVKVERETIDNKFCAGKAPLETLRFTCTLDGGEFSFPVYYVCPKDRAKTLPCFVMINFRDSVPDRYLPSEEIVDAGHAVLSFCYKDVSSDDADFTNGLAGIVYPDGVRGKSDCGKIGLWAWAAIRVLEYALTLPELDHARISVAGHSRLGKTALLAGALDERFYCAFSNDSGCSGASIARGSDGETIRKICDRFPYWFCEEYYKYADREDEMPFDQHYLLAANYPHRVYVASAEADAWACPRNEYLSCIAASEYYESRGKRGFVSSVEEPKAGDFFGDGYIGYHIRPGTHYFSREDWKRYIEYLSKCE